MIKTISSKFILFLIIPLILSIGIAPALMIDDAFAKTSKWYKAPEICGDKLCDNRNSADNDRERQEARDAAMAPYEAPVEPEPEAEPEKAMEEPAMEKPAAPLSFLFVQMATSGSFTETDDGKYLLVLEGINPQTIFFTDRPNRIAGHAFTEGFVSIWTMGKDSFEKDPPNAAITILEADETENAIIVELTNPVYDSETMTLQYTAQIIPDVTDGLSHLTEQIDTSIPEEFGHVAVFIDNFCSAFFDFQGAGATGNLVCN